MTLCFNPDDLRKLKHEHPEWVFLIGDKEKNPEKARAPCPSCQATTRIVCDGEDGNGEICCKKCGLVLTQWEVI